ncbi:hypothetical protein [Streptomyces acidiscabies]|uniref:hypothetical protein n=1 Tax=Streptomyces acidiscabies TaxID=42234 RepID=UPI00096836F4|nr:hypothetical protein [Streptomyces acidiscabies]GAV44850.1 hypothetical protein Saa2_07830 [Streptomyces acidiscabies]
MNPLQKIGAFGAALAVSFGAAYGVGALIGPFDTGTENAAHRSESHEGGAHESGSHEESGGQSTAPVPAGLQVSEGGYTLDLESKALVADRAGVIRFAVRGTDGRPVTSYRVEHEKELHLIVASRDLTEYRHLHPSRAADGTWSTPVTLSEPGSYRVFADFTPGEGKENLTLGSDLTVAGEYEAEKVPAPIREVTVDGYTVALDGGLAAGEGSELRFTVSKEGRPVRLEPYLGANGHLVALRAGDLAYLHVHPHDDKSGATEVRFTADVPSTGTYRLFLDFKADGKVRTAAFTAGTDQHSHG